MANKHESKIFPNFLLGIVLVSTGVLLIIYDIKSRLPEFNKYIIGFGIVLLINAGLYFWGSAFIHKVKSDLIKRQRSHKEKETVNEF